ncbi:MAG: ABC transporter ATP-binding protein [Chloroflexi bacterium]|nr:ABC transporter ATP-binding protein [Chloroflexota bacterium]
MSVAFRPPLQVGADPEPPLPLLLVDAVSHTYRLRGRALPVLDHVSLSLARDGFAAIVGPSGSGKSTLLGLIAGLEQPTTGRILVGGSADRLGRVGYMPQRDLLQPWRDALANATVALELRGVRRDAARRQAQALFEQFGLRGFERARPDELSGGMRQRVALARTVLAAGDLVLLDEPFGALDALTRAQMQDWLLHTWPQLGKAGLLVTHDVDEALLLADAVYVLSPRPGRIITRVRVPFARPRPRDLVIAPTFAELKLRLLAALGLAHAPSAAAAQALNEGAGMEPGR